MLERNNNCANLACKHGCIATWAAPQDAFATYVQENRRGRRAVPESCVDVKALLKCASAGVVVVLELGVEVRRRVAKREALSRKLCSPYLTAASPFWELRVARSGSYRDERTRSKRACHHNHTKYINPGSRDRRLCTGDWCCTQGERRRENSAPRRPRGLIQAEPVDAEEANATPKVGSI